MSEPTKEEDEQLRKDKANEDLVEDIKARAVTPLPMFTQDSVRYRRRDGMDEDCACGTSL